MSIASALIHATMSNVTRDMKQLEHWLGSLAAAPLAAASLASVPSEVSSTTSDDIMRSLHAQQTLLDQLHTTLQAQQHTIHHLTDRIQILEESRAAPETWMDPVEEEEIVPIYIVRKTEEPIQEIRQEPLIQITGGSIWKREIQEVQEEEEEEEVQEVPVKEESMKVEEPVKVEVPVKQEEPVKVEVPVKQEEIQEEVQEEEIQEEEIQEVPVKQEPMKEESMKVEVHVEKHETVKQEPVKVEVPVEEEEEEEGMELEIITFQGVSYYKDEEGFIYSIDEEEQPSEKAIGYWKKKAQAVAFYRSE